MATPPIDFELLRRLSVSERLQLVADLWDSIAADAPDAALPLDEGLAAELDRRWAAYERDRSQAQSWDEARAWIIDPERRSK